MLAIQWSEVEGRYWWYTILGLSVATWLGWNGLPVNGGNANGGQLPDGILFAINESDPLYTAIMEWDEEANGLWKPVVGTDGNMTGLEPL